MGWGNDPSISEVALVKSEVWLHMAGEGATKNEEDSKVFVSGTWCTGGRQLLSFTDLTDIHILWSQIPYEATQIYGAKQNENCIKENLFCPEILEQEED